MVLVLFATACGDVSKPVIDIDAAVGVIDAPDVLPDEMNPPPPPPPARRGGVMSTSGGGVIASTQHRMRVRIGAPQPMGTTSSSSHRITTGPGALP